jgi:hypothetical protein
VSCHADFAKAQARTAHASVACTSCHATGVAGRAGFAGVVLGRMLPARLLGRSVGGPVAETLRQACLSCHATVERTVSSASGVRVNHATCAPDASCDSCHATTGHGSLTRWKRGPVMEDCTACHAAQGAPVRCDACHIGKAASQRIITGPWQVTHGPNWRHTHGMGRLDSCVTCHPTDYCVQCHKVVVPHDIEFGRQHGALAVADSASCLTCHKTESFCGACHGIAMPHPTGFLKKHSSTATTIDDPVCARCHERQSCIDCHVAHIHPGFGSVRKGPTSSTTGGKR